MKVAFWLQKIHGRIGGRRAEHRTLTPAPLRPRPLATSIAKELPPLPGGYPRAIDGTSSLWEGSPLEDPGSSSFPLPRAGEGLG
jgi:hypothetical protein